MKQSVILSYDKFLKTHFTTNEVQKSRERVSNMMEAWEQEARQEIARAVKKARITSNLTQAEVAARINMSPSQVAYIESGKGNLTISSLQKVTKGMGKNLVVTIE